MPCERAFWSQNRIYTPQRGALGRRKLTKIEFLRWNLRWLEEYAEAEASLVPPSVKKLRSF